MADPKEDDDGISILGMSDEEISNMVSDPTPAKVVDDPTDPPVVTEPKGDDEPAAIIPADDDEKDDNEQDNNKQDEDPGTNLDDVEDEPDPTKVDDDPSGKDALKTDPEAKGEAVASDPKPKVDADGKPVKAAPKKKPAAEDKPAATVNVVMSRDDKAAAYDKIMAPFKANGKEIQLQNPEEAIKLQQMGANYTKKMQALQPSLRIVRMLENNKLLDEEKLSFLIDLDKRNPQAIQKLIKDSQFDTNTVDEEEADKYVPGNHQVGDAELSFQTVLDDIESTPTGPELIATVAQQWDADSKQALYQNPQILQVINEQKAMGLYDQIHGEVERQRMLGNLDGVPYLQAYRAVGDMLKDQGKLGGSSPKPEPVETRVKTPAKPASNDDRARAASTTKATPSGAKEEFNPLAQSDEEFLKTMEGRV